MVPDSDSINKANDLDELLGDLAPRSAEEALALQSARDLGAKALRSGQMFRWEAFSVLAGIPGKLHTSPPDNAAERTTVLVNRRSLPVFTTRFSGSLPAWSAGRRVDQTLGPFRDQLGRDVWIDVFTSTRQVHFTRVAGTAPFLTLPINVAERLTRTIAARKKTVANQYNIPPGSLWLASPLLAASAPSGSFTGLRINGGKIRFSQPLSISADEVVVPAGVDCDIEIELEAPAAPAGSGPGADSRGAKFAPPSRVAIKIGATAAVLKVSDIARVLAYGFDTEFEWLDQPIRYLGELNRLAVPFRAKSGPFSVNQTQSALFAPTGSAAIMDSAWGLPAAVIDPSQFGEASGVGAMLMWTGDGLNATWIGQASAVALGPSLLAVDESRLSLSAAEAKGYDVAQYPVLTNENDSRLKLVWKQSFPVAFFAQGIGSEAVLSSCGMEASMARPVDLSGERLSLGAQSASVGFIATAQGTFLLAQGAVDTPKEKSLLGFALKNAILRTSFPARFVLSASYDGQRCDSGIFALSYRLSGLVPTLPDPYAANYRSLIALFDRPSGVLLSYMKWSPVAREFDFILPRGQSVPQAGQRPQIASFGGSNATDMARLAVRGETSEVLTGAIAALGDSLEFEQQRGMILLDVSTNLSQFGVAFKADREQPSELGIQGLSLQATGRQFVLLTLPAVQWEALYTEADPDPTFPPRLGFATSGVPSLIGVPTAKLVPVHPEAAIKRLVDNFADANPEPAEARFTLPFGMIAKSTLKVPDTVESRGAKLTPNRPQAGALTGAHQLRIDAIDMAVGAGDSPSLPGFTVQLPVGQPGWRSALGDQVTITFNSYLGAAGFRRMVPVERLDLSGYGESLFSDWRNPYADPVAVSQARFDVMAGRTAHEVVQVRSYLFPHAVQVVRTITISRKNSAIVGRKDSGWQAASDGVYAFPGPPQIDTHPGVVRRITNVTHIRETGQILTIDGIALAAMRFDGDLEIDGSAALVPVANHIGFVQLTAGSLMPPATYAKLIAAAGSMGGAVDTVIQIGGGPQAMRVSRVGVGFTQGMAGPEFVMAAWGNLRFPGGGDWSMLQLDDPGAAPKPLPRDRGLPLIRAGLASAPPLPISPYRFADPADLAQPGNPSTDYGILHATGTQRAFFPRPKIEATDTSRITSTQVPALADAYSLATALGPFPELGKTIPFPGNNWALRVAPDGNFRLDLPVNPFPAGVGRRTTRQAGSVKSDLDYSSAIVTYEVDTAQAVPWRFKVEKAVKIMNSTSLGDVIQLEADLTAAADRQATFDKPKLRMGGSLSVVQDLLTILADLGISGILNVDMTNEWSLKVGLKIPFVDAMGKPYQIPPLVPVPDIKFEDTGVAVSENILPANDEAEFEIEGTPMFSVKAIPGLYVAAIIKFQIKLSTESGTTFTFLLGFGVAYSIDIIEDVMEAKGLFALTFFGFVGDTTIGFGIGFLLKLGVEVQPIISVEVSLEGKLALVWGCKGAPAETLFGAAKLTFGIEVTICLFLSISFEVETEASTVIQGPGEPACALPGVL